MLGFAYPLRGKPAYFLLTSLQLIVKFQPRYVLSGSETDVFIFYFSIAVQMAQSALQLSWRDCVLR